MAKEKFVQLENKNAILELLREKKPLNRIYIAQNAFKDPKTKEILSLASGQKINIIKSSRKTLNRLARGSSIESVIAFAPMENSWNIRELLDKLYSQNITPFLLLLDHLKYEQNVGAILRTAYAAGVNGVITVVKKENFLTSEAIRISTGAALRIPIVEMNLFAAMKELKKDGVKIYAVTMEGNKYYEENLKGPVCFVLGAEDVGISTRVLEKCDKNISIPMREGLGSLNVSASTAIVCYEKLRQEVTV